MPSPTQRHSLYSLLTYLCLGSLLRLGIIENRATVNTQDMDNTMFAGPKATRFSTSKQAFIQDSEQKSRMKKWKKTSTSGNLQRLSNTQQMVSMSPWDTKRTDRTLTIATAPQDKYHLVALWSQLECLDFDTVILAAPTWSKPLLDKLVELAYERIPKYATSNLKILQVHYYKYDRFEIGLWCDAIDEFQKQRQQEDAFYGLSNDSVFAVRPFSGLLDRFDDDHHHPKLEITSLLQYTNQNGATIVDSMFRGFNNKGLRTFQDHSCSVSAEDQMYCPPDRAAPLDGIASLSKRRKRCAKQMFETSFLHEYSYDPDRVEGMWPKSKSAPQQQYEFFRKMSHGKQHPADLYGRWLIEHEKFPVATRPTMIRTKYLDRKGADENLLEQCTRYMVPIGSRHTDNGGYSDDLREQIVLETFLKEMEPYIRDQKKRLKRNLY